jgi:hypothetical protein
VAATRINRKDLARVTMSYNQLDLSLSKHIRYEFIVKINDKMKLRICEALGQISTDYLRARHAPTCIASPLHARPGERASEHVCFFFSSPPHTCKYIESNPFFK